MGDTPTRRIARAAQRPQDARATAGGASNGALPATAVRILRLQQTYGNQAVLGLLQRELTDVVRLQRTPAPSGAAPTTEFSRPRVSTAVSILYQARDLACYEPTDLAGARALIQGLDDWIDEVSNISQREKAFRSLGWGSKRVAMETTGHSVDAVRSLLRKLALWQRDSDDPVPPMHRSQWDYHITEFQVGMEFLEVVTGERTLAQTAAAAIDEGALVSIDILVSTMPVIGTALIIGEVIVGRDLAGHKLSGLQRAVLGGLVILSELGTLTRAARATTAAARLAALSRAEVGVLRDISQARAAGLVAGARSLTSSERSLLKRLAHIIKAGGKLTREQVLEANSLLGKMNEQAMVAEALQRNASKLAGANGLVVEEGANITKDTSQVGEKLLRSGRFKQGLALVEQNIEGVRTGDFVMDGQLVEAYKPSTSKVGKVISEVARYHRQAGTFAIDLERSAITSADLISQLPRLWGRPEATDISLIIILNGEQVIDVARPVNLGLADLAAVGAPAAAAGWKAANQSNVSGPRAPKASNAVNQTIAVPARLVNDVNALHRDFASARAWLVEIRHGTGGEAVALDELQVAEQATDYSETSPFRNKANTERFQVTVEALNEAMGVLTGPASEHSDLQGMEGRLRLIKIELGALLDRWPAMAH